MRSVHRIRLTFTLLGALALSGCLDDDGGSGDDTSTGQVNFNGFNGLSYQTASQSGTTNAAGEFRYYPGKPLMFLLGIFFWRRMFLPRSTSHYWNSFPTSETNLKFR